MVMAIIAEEVSGCKVSINYGGPTVEITQRMSSARTGVCNPAHMNIEAWASSTMSNLRVYFNKSYQVGGVGYFGLAGVYTSHSLVEEGTNSTPPYYPDFWKHYKSSDVLIDKLGVVPFKANPAYNPPATSLCPDGYMGCKDNCERSEAYTREAAGGTCLVVALMKPGYDRGYFPGHALKHWCSSLLLLPRLLRNRVKLSTGDYGEHGYGNNTNNPLDVDVPSLQLAKFASLLVKDLPVGSLFSKLTLSDTDINHLLSKYSTVLSDKTESQPYFRAACNWVKTNYDVWGEWLDRLPLCTIETHILRAVLNGAGGRPLYQTVPVSEKLICSKNLCDYLVIALNRSGVRRVQEVLQGHGGHGLRRPARDAAARRRRRVPAREHDREVRRGHRGLVRPRGPRRGTLPRRVLREHEELAVARRRHLHAGRVPLAAPGPHRGRHAALPGPLSHGQLLVHDHPDLPVGPDRLHHVLARPERGRAGQTQAHARRRDAGVAALLQRPDPRGRLRAAQLRRAQDRRRAQVTPLFSLPQIPYHHQPTDPAHMLQELQQL
ncbi:hypothetical protein ON010_g12135 [Phytophthora cinnamomi]|nr:hypothetical protein ON010_g12135 [Phytophthora cinnamomi]